MDNLKTLVEDAVDAYMVNNGCVPVDTIEYIKSDYVTLAYKLRDKVAVVKITGLEFLQNCPDILLDNKHFMKGFIQFRCEAALKKAGIV